MNLMRDPARRLGRRQPPLMRQYWLHRSLRQRQGTGEGEDVEHQIDPTESGEAAPDDQT